MTVLWGLLPKSALKPGYENGNGCVRPHQAPCSCWLGWTFFRPRQACLKEDRKFQAVQGPGHQRQQNFLHHPSANFTLLMESLDIRNYSFHWKALLTRWSVIKYTSNSSVAKWGWAYPMPQVSLYIFNHEKIWQKKLNVWSVHLNCLQIAADDLCQESITQSWNGAATWKTPEFSTALTE